MDDRLDRNIRFFGREGQDRLRHSAVAVVGVGGLGTHVVQQLALLGVGSLALIDDEVLHETNLNRYVGVCMADVGARKVDLAERLVHYIDPSTTIHKLHASLMTSEAFEAVRKADYVFGCLDNEGGRLVLTELCAAHERPYLDIASDIHPGPPMTYGGRVCIAWSGDGCLICLDQLDANEARQDLESPAGRADRDAIYGVPQGQLDAAGPSVVSLNGVAASLAVTEFMAGVTGLRPPKTLLIYRGHLGIVSSSADKPAPDCYYCKGIRGRPSATDLERFLHRA